MKEVSKEEFFAMVWKVGQIHPRSERDASYWETPNRTLKGKSTPGYLCKGPTRYFIAEN